MIINCSIQEGKSPLYLAAESGQTDVAEVLIANGANVNMIDLVRNL